jgi:hypothetical protein
MSVRCDDGIQQIRSDVGNLEVLKRSMSGVNQNVGAIGDDQKSTEPGKGSLIPGSRRPFAGTGSKKDQSKRG